MWVYIIRHILRNRLGNLVGIGLLTAFMTWEALHVQLSYESGSLLPSSDSASIIYTEFSKRFGKEDGVMFIGMEDPTFFSLEKYNDWFDLTNDIKKVSGVQEVVSITRLYQLVKNDSLKKFDFRLVSDKKPETQSELDSIKAKIYGLVFYDKLLYNRESGAHLMAVTLEESRLNTRDRVELVYRIRQMAEQYSQKHNIKIRFSGLPYIRTITAKKLERELLFFVGLAVLITAVFLLIFFRSFKAVFFPMIVVMICVAWVLGSMSLLGFKITMLTSIIPPLLIVIVVENCIFLLNKYHYEFKSHGNKVKALSRAVQRIGSANLITNAATAAGFGTFISTGNRFLVEFGVVASINIMVAYILCLVLIPVFFSYLPPPQKKHTKHLEKSTVGMLIEKLTFVFLNRRNHVYIAASVLLLISVLGMIRLRTTGRIVDDIPKKDALYQDLMFIEKHFGGVMPFEIAIDTKKVKGVQKMSTIQGIEDLQGEMAKFPELSKPLSVAEVFKFAKQSFYNGNEKMYSLPNNNERNFILSYVPVSKGTDRNILNSIVDSTGQYTRISTRMANIGTNDIERIQRELKPKIDSVFPKDKFDIRFTGTSVVFLKGTHYLDKDLFTSLLLAVLIISLLMALLFTSLRMIIVSLVPNIIPLILTAAMMGFFGIPIKPSTVLIFSIALGISVDNTIQFLSRYRLQLKHHKWAIRESVIAAISETGFSMIYSSVVLFFGFSIFILSSFGGTQSLGYLIAFTLLAALLSNLFVLPSLILTLDKWMTTKVFQEPLLEILEEDDEDSEPGDSETVEGNTENLSKK
jgi:predicted RND superfamily exporter protein